jgi:tripartite-type tricarboxylate transporter receptor subunit TctC
MTMHDSGNSALFSPGGHAGQLRRVDAAAKPRSLGNHATLFNPVPPARPWHFVGCLGIALALLLGSGGCQRQRGYPNRPIMLICPWAAGGGTDQVSRQVGALLEQELGVPVNVINATGGAGVTGHTRGALARPDGYTLTMVTVEINMLHWRGLTNISYQDYDPVGLINCDAAALFVRSDAPWHNLSELEQYVRASSKPVKASGTANGGIWHLAFVGWLDKIGVSPARAIWSPNNGASPSLQELIAGGVDTVCCSLPEAQTLLESGRVRCLGVMAAERVEQFPDVPTFKEQGVDWTLGGWRGICLPKNTPPQVTRRVVAALERVARSDTFRTYMRRCGFNVTWEPPAEFEKTMQEVDARLGKLLTSEALSIQPMWFGPMFFPGILGGLLAAVFVGLLLTGGLRKAHDAERITPQGLMRLAEIVAWVVAYLLLAEWIGFLLVAAVLLTLLLRRLGNGWPLAVAVSIVIVPLTYQLFAVWLRVPLPRGWLGW